MRDKLTAICERHILPDNISATIREPYIPYMPQHWNGILVLAEAQNHGARNPEYLTWLQSLSSVQRIQRLYNNPISGEIGVHPWDDCSLKIAVEAALHVKAEETAVSNASLWSQVRKGGQNQNPNQDLMERSVLLWKEMVKVFDPKQIVTAGKVAKNIVLSIGREPIAWILPSPLYLSRITGIFSEKDLMKRYPEVVKLMSAKSHYFAKGCRKNKIFYACHAISRVDVSIT